MPRASIRRRNIHQQPQVMPTTPTAKVAHSSCVLRVMPRRPHPAAGRRYTEARHGSPASAGRSAELGLGDQDMVRLIGDAVEPSADARIAGELEIALLGDMGVAVERDIRDRVALADEELAALEMALHGLERLVALLPFLLQSVGPLLALAERMDPEASDGNLRLVAILFEEHPLQHLGAFEAVGRQERGSLREIEQNGVGLRQAATVVEDDRWDAPIRVDGEEFRRACLALE